MSNSVSFLKKPVAAFCISISILLAMIGIARNASTAKLDNNNSVFSITIKHYGINAKEIERTISIPLEDHLYNIDGVKNVVTASENGKSRAYIYFKNTNKLPFIKNKSIGRYEAISDAAQRIYESLPASAQRPEINSASESRNPVWMAAVYSNKDRAVLNSIIENIVKPKLSSIDGTAEVEISGYGVNEIIIALRPEYTIDCGISASMIAEYLSSVDIMQPAGFIENDKQRILVTVDSRYFDLNMLKNEIIPLQDGAYSKLKDIASVVEQERMPDIISRLNGKKTIVVSILPSYGVNSGKLSKNIKKSLDDLKNYDIEFEILKDEGKEELNAYYSVLSAALQGSIIVALLTALLSYLSGKNKWYKTSLISAIYIPYICIITICFMMIAGFSFDKILLAGVTAGIGSAIDTVIICGESFLNVSTINEAKTNLRYLRVPVISSALTTIIALFPVFSLKFVEIDVITIAFSIGAVNLFSLLLSLTLLPTFYFSFGTEDKNRIIKTHNIKKLRRRFVRCFGFILNISVKHPFVVCGTALIITICGMLVLLIIGMDSGMSEVEGAIYAQAEFQGGLRSDIIDTRLAAWAAEIKLHKGIKNVQTGASNGSGNILVSFNTRETGAVNVREIIKNEQLYGGFIYIPENTKNDRIWTITVFGDEDEKCRQIATETAQICSTIPVVKETVLNFKDGGPNITFIPDRKRLSEYSKQTGMDFIFSELSKAARWNVFGPVAYKRISFDNSISNSDMVSKEVDVRIRGNGLNKQTKSDVQNISLYAGVDANIIKFDAVSLQQEDFEPSMIRREGRRRAASISIKTKPADARKIRNTVMPYIKRNVIPQGYVIEFDKKAVDNAEALSGTVFYFLVSLLFCYMIIAAVNESFYLPLIVLSVIPPSISVPVLYLILSGQSFNSAAACALIVVSGISVNSAVITVDAIRKEKGGIYKAIRQKIPMLLSTTGTTIMASLPFIFLNEGANTVIKTLSIVTSFGVTSSFILSITVIPALSAVKRNIFYR